MKILFLDVDGVLNNDRALGRAARHNLPTFALDRHCLGLLKDIVHATGARIVVSSTWRVNGWKPGTHGHLLLVALSMWDLSMHSSTSLLDEAAHSTKRATRGDAIDKWLKEQSDIIDSICILDDLPPSEFGSLAEFHVRTTLRDGLTASTAERAIDMLRSRNFSRVS